MSTAVCRLFRARGRHRLVFTVPEVRRHARATAGLFLVYGVSLLFFLPVFVFGSPYAAVAGMTVAHGYQ